MENLVVNDLVVNGAVIIGAVNLLTIAFPKTTSLQKIVAALVVGGVLPYLPDLGLAFQGVQLALGASGIYKIGQKLGGK